MFGVATLLLVVVVLATGASPHGRFYLVWRRSCLPRSCHRAIPGQRAGDYLWGFLRNCSCWFDVQQSRARGSAGRRLKPSSVSCSCGHARHHPPPPLSASSTGSAIPATTHRPWCYALRRHVHPVAAAGRTCSVTSRIGSAHLRQRLGAPLGTARRTLVHTPATQ